MPLPLTVSCFSKIQIGFTFLVPAHLGSPGKRAVKRVCVCVYVNTLLTFSSLKEHSVLSIKSEKMVTTRNESVPKIITNDKKTFLKTAISILVISNRNSFQVLFDEIASVCFV